MSAAVVKMPRPRPFSSDVLVEIPRGEKARLRIEVVRWNEEDPSVVALVLLLLGRSGAWYVSRRFTIRREELSRVAAMLREVSE